MCSVTFRIYCNTYNLHLAGAAEDSPAGGPEFGCQGQPDGGHGEGQERPLCQDQHRRSCIQESRYQGESQPNME